MFLSTLPFVIGVTWAEQAAIATGVIVLTGLMAIYILARNRQWVIGWIDKAGERWSLVKKLAGRRVVAFFDGLGILTDGRLFLRALGWEGLQLAGGHPAILPDPAGFFPFAQPVVGAICPGCGGVGDRGTFFAGSDRSVRGLHPGGCAGGVRAGCFICNRLRIIRAFHQPTSSPV